MTVIFESSNSNVSIKSRPVFLMVAIRKSKGSSRLEALKLSNTVISFPNYGLFGALTDVI